MQDVYTTDNMWLAAFLFRADESSLVEWKDISALDPNRSTRNRGKPIYEFAFSNRAVQLERVEEYTRSGFIDILGAMSKLKQKTNVDHHETQTH